MNNITLVIPTIGSHTHVVQTLRSVLLNKNLPYEILIVDQNKHSTTAQKLKKIFNDFNYKKFKIFKSLINPSLTKAKNTSIRYLKTEKVIFLDDDMIINRNFIFEGSKLSTCSNNIVSGIIKNQNIKLNFLNNFLYNLFFKSIFKDNREYFFSKKKKIHYPKNYVAGGITIYDKHIFKKIKFDEKSLKHNYEDVDFCIRLKSKFPKIKFIISQNMKTTEQNISSGREDASKRFHYLNLLFKKHKNKTNLINYLLAYTGLLIKYNISIQNKKK